MASVWSVTKDSVLPPPVRPDCTAISTAAPPAINSSRAAKVTWCLPTRTGIALAPDLGAELRQRLGFELRGRSDLGALSAVGDTDGLLTGFGPDRIPGNDTSDLDVGGPSAVALPAEPGNIRARHSVTDWGRAFGSNASPASIAA